MSRTSLHTPRRTRAVLLRTATGTRLFPCPFPPNVPPHIPHYKRCPKAHRLRLRSDQSLSLPVYVTGYGRFPDKKRHALSKSHCQVRAPLTRRIRFASSGDAPEHSVMSPPWAIAPCSDSPRLDLAGESEQSDERRLKTNAPFLDAAVAALAGQSEQSDERRLKTNAPFRDSTVVTTGELRSTNAGHGSTLPSLRVVERFWWSRLPHREPIARLFHIPSEVRGCRKAGFDVEHPLPRKTPIGTGVAAFLRNRPGPSIPSLPLVHCPTRDDRPVAQGVGAPRVGRPHPSPHPRKEPPTSPYPHNLPCSSLPLLRRPSPSESAKQFAWNNQTGTSF